MGILLSVFTSSQPKEAGMLYISIHCILILYFSVDLILIPYSFSFPCVGWDWVKRKLGYFCKGCVLNELDVT